MDRRIILLTIVAFVVGMAELIIGGILDLIADDFSVTISDAGWLITIFSLVFAIGAPILLVATQKLDRKTVALIALFVFFCSNLIAIFSTTFSMLFIARIVGALSGSLLAVLCLTLASSIVESKYVGRAIGIVIMGTSASLVLGVPIGLLIGNSFGWRAPFILIAALTLVSMLGVYLFMGRIEPTKTIPLLDQIKTLKNRKILFAQLTMFFYLAGHLAIYAFLTPFAKDILMLNSTWTSVVYFIFGIAAVCGGGLGGTLSDRFGAKRVILSANIIFACALFSLPFTQVALPFFFAVLIIWGMMSWSITPALQSYLIEIAPETAAIQQSLNNSALHLGIAFGSYVGGVVVTHTSVLYTPIAGGALIVIALISALISMKGQTPHPETAKVK